MPDAPMTEGVPKLDVRQRLVVVLSVFTTQGVLIVHAGELGPAATGVLLGPTLAFTTIDVGVRGCGSFEP